MKIKAVNGTQDILPYESYKWLHIETRIRQFMSNFHYKETRTPIFEYTNLFSHAIGEETDIVSKEMYSFPDSAGRMLTLRPENTASVVRMNIQYNLPREFPQNKLYYLGPMFRRERPQKGRYRQFHQFGIEAIGPKSAELDFETILLAVRFYESFQLDNIQLRINSIGNLETRNLYIKTLRNFVKPKLVNYCDECKNRFEKNPLRILDCKIDIERNKNAPKILDFLNQESRNNFERIIELLKYNKIDYVIEHHLVRGLDYYSDLVFEVICKDIGSQSAICGGGRYDGLFERFSGKSISSTGFAGGMERLILALEANHYPFPKRSLELFIATTDSQSRLFASKIIDEIRSENISVETDYLERTLKAQMKYANKISALYVIIIGEDELKSQQFGIKNMATGETIFVEKDQILKTLKSVLNYA